MSVSEDRRIAVLEAATHHWGRDVAVTLMEMLPPSGWGDVATRQQVDALRDEMHREFAVVRAEMHREFAVVRAESRAEFAELRTELAGLRAEFAELRAEFAEGQRRTLQWTISTVIAMSMFSTAIITLVR